VFISAGSNVEPGKHLHTAMERLGERFGPLTASSVYRNRPVGFEGGDFLNLVIRFTTTESPAAIVAELQRLHDAAGRVREANPFGPRTLDLDLLLYGDQVLEDFKVPRPDITRYSFVLGPLAELAPDLRHPVTGKTMALMWQEFDQTLHPIHRLPGFMP
jgi:2-amino-4-hydroxy-6-hydroxymethyldihydropteridine diphosphokinase